MKKIKLIINILLGLFVIVFHGVQILYPMIRKDVISKSGWPYYPMWEPNIGTIRFYYGDIGWTIRDLYDFTRANLSFFFVLCVLSMISAGFLFYQLIKKAKREIEV